MNTYPTQLRGNFNVSSELVTFVSDRSGNIEIHTSSAHIQDILHLLYFSANAHKIYNGMRADPPFFAKEVAVSLTCDESIFHALLEMLKQKKSRNLLQTIKYWNEAQDTDWKSYLLIGLGFEVLFSLNPSFPSADLRQHLRPLLHLKYSHPVELLWKWVDQFYAFRHAVLKGDFSLNPLFIENPNVQSPLLLIAKKLLIYAIYDSLFMKDLIVGSSGTLSTPDDFSSIHPERVLVYFWTLDTLHKKRTLLKLQPSNEKDLMIKKIEAMHKQLQETPSEEEKFIA